MAAPQEVDNPLLSPQKAGVDVKVRGRLKYVKVGPCSGCQVNQKEADLLSLVPLWKRYEDLETEDEENDELEEGTSGGLPKAMDGYRLFVRDRQGW